VKAGSLFDAHPAARAFYRLTKALLTRRQPIYVIYEITDRCNLRCRMCSVWRRANKEDELGLDEIETLASRLYDMGVVVVSLSGGEPFMRDDLPEVARIFKRKGLITRLMTNAVDVSEKKIRAIVEAGIDSISVSLNTLFPEEEAYICRNDSALWEKVVSNMVLFSNIVRKRGSLLIMSTCVSSINVDQLPLLEEFASFIGFRANFMPTELAPKRKPGLRFSDCAPELELSVADRTTFINSMNTLLQRKRRGTVLNSTRFLQEMRKFVLQNGRHCGICDAGTLYFTVDPAGRFSICHEFRPEDSLLSPGFISRFESPRAQDHWRNLRRACPGCMHPCWMEVSNTFRHIWPLAQTASHFAGNYRKRKPITIKEALDFASSLRGRLGRGPRVPAE